MVLKEEIKAGIIVVVSLAILSGSVILIGGSSLFEKIDKYYVKFMNASGLETGAQVRLGGVRVGRVTNIQAPEKPGDPVTLEVGVKRGTILYKGTKAQVGQIGFVGDIFLLLAVENTTNDRIRPGDIIPSDEKVQFDTLMSKVNGLSKSVDTLIIDIDKLFSQKNLKGIETLIGNTNSAIVSGSSNLDKVAASLKGTTDKLERVLNEVEDVIRGNKGEVTLLIRRAREDIEKAEGMIKSIESTAKSVEKTSKSADRLIISQSKNLDNLLNTMTRTTEELQELLQEIKNKPWSIIYKEKRGE
jgi:phospholipid/cholesterol/gamma-HCH transport system substrate-binding protein